MDFTFRAVAEPAPGPKWAALFAEFWPAYRRWWARESTLARPSYRACLTALETHMPEIVPLYNRLCRLAGGGDGALPSTGRRPTSPAAPRRSGPGLSR